jgi:hypothetical protein
VNWLNPSAWLGALLLAVPLLIHLLSRRSAQQRRFPTVRFFDEARISAVRRARVTDVPLLILRMLILLAAVAALAQPQVLTNARRGAVLQQTARIVVVDTSASMRRAAQQGGTLLQHARAMADAEREPAAAVVVETATPGAVLAAAGDLLARRAGIRELVVISDFQDGAVTTADVALIPSTVGVRLERVRAADPLAADAAQAPPGFPTVYAPAHRQSSMRAAVAVGLEGAPQLPRTVVLVAGADEWASTLARVPERPALPTALAAALAQDDVVRATAARLDARLELPAGALPVAWSDHGVAAALTVVDDALLLLADTSELLVAALIAAAGAGPAVRELATLHVADSSLAQWQRPAVARAGPAGVADSDGRWLWLAVLVLLLGELFLRRRVAAAPGAP